MSETKLGQAGSQKLIGARRCNFKHFIDRTFILSEPSWTDEKDLTGVGLGRFQLITTNVGSWLLYCVSQIRDFGFYNPLQTSAI